MLESNELNIQITSSTDIHRKNQLRRYPFNKLSIIVANIFEENNESVPAL